ncbi:MAG TPA: fumarylacetoacetate hydrolase, partial [Acetobacteraceae bacterium]|nr:fumarylacetoacetate hydrolase [Acetobacteraceae bacterium]
MAAIGDTLLPVLPDDSASAALAGRVWRPDVAGPSVVAVRNGDLLDVSSSFPTMRDLCETDDPAAALRQAEGEALGSIDALLANTPVETRDT